MKDTYDPAQFEQDAQRYWEQNQSFKAVEDPKRQKFYCLSESPYPSGRLHMGHVRTYTIGDVISRYQRMLGKNVMQPMGWDAFGLPAETAAIQYAKSPAEWTYSNIEHMKTQLKRLGFGYDWNRELTTCDPDYYKWEQWLFTRLMDKGLAYRKKTKVNWDPLDQTVLASEQVINGKVWRSGADVEKREIEQWFIKITDYAHELLDDIEKLDAWPVQVCDMQSNCIGRSEYVEMHFGIEGSEEELEIFTTRPDTVMGVTYVAVAAEHPLAERAAEGRPGLAAFIDECKQGRLSEAAIETMEKKGHALGINAIHPITGEPVPIFAANFVLMSYGTGAVMAVPGHDQRDWEFAEKYGIPRKQVIFPVKGEDPDIVECAYVEKGLLNNSGPFDGLTSEQAFDAIAEYLEKDGKGGKRINFRLRDWCVSRQSYWGCPVPVIRDAEGNIEPATEFPVRLPEDVVVDGSGSPLTKMPEFFDLGDGRMRETDTFDTFLESSWYHARYCSSDCDTAMLDQRARYWLPVDQYVGGIWHLLYARFFNKLLRDEGLLDNDEPFIRLLTPGVVLAETYYRDNLDGLKHWYNPADVEVERDERGRVLKAILKEDCQPVTPGGIEKISKSKNNGVDPHDLIERFGADTVRLYTIFAAPSEQSLEWNDEGVESAHRFLKRLWSLAVRNAGSLQDGSDQSNLNESQQTVRREIHCALKQANLDYELQRYHTVVSACMTMVRALYKLGDADTERGVLHEGLGIVLRLLAPIAPHITHQLWRELGYGDDILNAGWPKVDESALVRGSIQYVVQVNGKVRAKVWVPADADKAAIEAEALANANVQKFIGDAQVRRVFWVPNKLVNIVAK